MSSGTVGFLVSYKTRQTPVFVHKQIINTHNINNYTYLGILAKFFVGLFCKLESSLIAEVSA